MIPKTKTAIKRDARNERIAELYTLYRSQGSKKHAAVEHIARELKTSVTTVNRIVKPIAIA